MILFLIEISIFLIVLFLWWHEKDKERYSKYPPGPLRFPIIGSLPQVIQNTVVGDLPSTTFKRLAKIYGDENEMLFLKLGQTETIIFNSLETMHEMLTHEKALGRYQYEVVKDRNGNRNQGLLWGWSKRGQNLRRFTMRNLRDFGFGKSSTMDVVINEEIWKFQEHFIKEVECAPGNVVHVEDMFSLSVVNVLWRLVSGRPFDLEDPKMKKWVQLNRYWFASTKVGSDLSELFPFLRDWFPKWTGREAQKRTHKELYDYGKELLLEQREQGSSDSSTPETFIEAFNRKIEETKDDHEKFFGDEQFIFTILDLFLAGSETSSNTLNFSILYMMLFPEVQEKVQAELDNNIPPGTCIDSAMKSRLPYTSATILEILRYSSVVPIPSSREATEDFVFQGYLIKKGTALLPNVYGLHFCEKLWGDPRNFRPERFLNVDGTAIDRRVADQLKLFGAGKRYCLGQSLAEMTIFLYFTSTLRKFKFVKVPGTNPSVEPMVGLTLAPKPYDVQVIERTRIRNEGIKDMVTKRIFNVIL